MIILGETALDLAQRQILFVENTEEKAKIADFLREHGKIIYCV